MRIVDDSEETLALRRWADGCHAVENANTSFYG